MAEDLLRTIKKRTISALVSDQVFMGILVLKGGNALDVVYDITSRGSLDIDFSMENDFTEVEKDRMKNQAKYLLNKEFNKEGLTAFDVKFSDRPKTIDESVEDFWGGYLLEFKLAETNLYESSKDDIDKVRRAALSVGKKGSTKFKVDISKYEYVGQKKLKDLDGAIVQVYSPEMIALEKLRAICQQTTEYIQIIKTMHIRPRSRDFYDIVNLCETFRLDFNNPENIELAANIFDAKRVPLQFIGNIVSYKDFHFGDWESVVQTVSQKTEIQPFDYYFENVINTFKHLTN